MDQQTERWSRTVLIDATGVDTPDVRQQPGGKTILSAAFATDQCAPCQNGIRSVITQSKIPPESFFSHISKLCMEEWQDLWDTTLTNKLFSIFQYSTRNI